MKRREFIKLAAISTIPYTVPIPINFDDNETRFIKYLMKNYPVEEALELTRRYVLRIIYPDSNIRGFGKRQLEFIRWMKGHGTREEILKRKFALSEADHNRLDREFEQLVSKFNLGRGNDE